MYKKLYEKTKMKYFTSKKENPPTVQELKELQVQQEQTRYPSIIVTVPGTITKCGVNLCNAKTYKEITCESCGESLCKYHQVCSKPCKSCKRMRCTKSCAVAHGLVCGVIRLNLVTE